MGGGEDQCLHGALWLEEERGYVRGWGAVSEVGRDCVRVSKAGTQA